jgi:mannose-6-phosphate isomerase-like protein (cupin superfamily)
MENIYDTTSIISKIESNNKKNNESYFLDILNTNSLDAGILVLKPGQKDIQQPHSSDEIYYIIEGNGFIEIDKEIYPLQKGTCIFVPSNTSHRFFGNTIRLVTIYIFGK